VASILKKRGFRAHPEAKLVDLLTLSLPKGAKVKIQQHFPKTNSIAKEFSFELSHASTDFFPSTLRTT